MLWIRWSFFSTEFQSPARLSLESGRRKRKWWWASPSKRGKGSENSLLLPWGIMGRKRGRGRWVFWVKPSRTGGFCFNLGLELWNPGDWIILFPRVPSPVSVYGGDWKCPRASLNPKEDREGEWMRAPGPALGSGMAKGKCPLGPHRPVARWRMLQSSRESARENYQVTVELQEAAQLSPAMGFCRRH